VNQQSELNTDNAGKKMQPSPLSSQQDYLPQGVVADESIQNIK